ncbi:sn1-specific diacylglycerol lipase alpha-like isoform X2 [Mizuhopecten yessoensis]|uniref:sn1-specific diacylglycerol lipase alpha-like isoform X2 n=1 Tax=Mizuhopecten yessoensis TaxID=6573 RepID=UPI000B45C002|nr:sn1-specific diacylglycerol lipase alpha-like isoform X2 [Mizuhopecten yessoensis]
MPGIVVFRRRWSFGSDDLVVPSIFLLTIHLTWTVILGVVTGNYDFDLHKECSVGLVNLKYYLIGYLSMLAGNILVEGMIFGVSMRGTILNPSPRLCMQYLLYFRLAILLVELAWQILGVIWMAQHYHTCGPVVPMKAALGLIVCNWVIMLTVFVSLWCTYDIAGRKWVKMKRYQESMKEKSYRNKRNSGRRNWRHRLIIHEPSPSLLGKKAIRAYEESWDRRFKFLCCCVERDATNRNSIAEVAKLFTEFFRDLDVVPSDVIAGFVLLRRHQKLQMHHVVTEGSNDVYQYLSGRAITPQTEFLQLGQPEVMEEYKLVVHYMRFALAAYGWPAFMMMNTGTGLCKMLPSLRCCCCHACGSSFAKDAELIDDNCCHCNFVALLKLSGLKEADIAYVTYHVEIGETPFYVALDHRHKKVVICVRGTLSLQDVLTDLKADAETLPLNPVKEEWVGHKGMVQAAVYIQKKLKDDRILAKAFGMDLDRGTQKYDLVLVGHSLGAGTASILAILLRQEYPTLHCYAFSPPGGLLSDVCVDETKSFITSVVVGKDVVPRIGLSQLEVLRTDLINVIKNSTQPKWKIIARGLCCGSEDAEKLTLDDIQMEVERDNTAHPLDSQIGLSTHRPLYPPGKIIHVVRSHPRGKKKRLCGSGEPVFQAVWAHNTSFDEVIVSPTMINDHMPDNVMDALEKVLVNVAPPKPNRTLTEAERKAFLQKRSPSVESENSNHKLIIQEDFTIGKTAPVCNQLPLYKPHHQSLPPLFSWDHAAEEHRFLLDKDFLHPGDPGKQELYLDLGTDTITAPLASPETLSEISSVGSALSRIGSLNKDNKRRSIIIPQVLETIQQSPVSKNKVGDFPPITEPIHLNGQVSKTPQIGNCLHIKTDVVIESPPKIRHESDKSTKRVNDSLVPLLCDSTDQDNCDIVGNGSHEFQNKVYNRHSPVDGNQYEYGNPNVYYSAGGIGYPHGSGAYHPPTCNVNTEGICTECMNHSLSDVHSPQEEDSIIKCSQSESQLLHLSARYVMKRSTEQRDIAHLQDSMEVFQGDATSQESQQTTNSHRSRLLLKGANPITSEGTQASTNSLEDDSDRRLSSSHSDEVFDLPLEETDV